VNAPIPTTGTGLKGDWLLGPHGGVRVDLGVRPPGLIACCCAATWATVRDLLTTPVEDPEPLEAPRRWRSVRTVAAGPVRHDSEAVFADADKCIYSAPRWLLAAVSACKDAGLGVLVTEDTGHHQDVLVVRQGGDVVAFVGVRRLERAA